MSLSETTAPLTRRGIPVERDLRVLALGSFANRFGAGAVMTTSALYFTRQVGFSAAEVSFAIAASAIVGILVQVPAGHLGDSRGPRKALTLFMVGAALTSALPVLARTPWQLALLLGLLALFERSAGSVQQGVIAQLATGGRGVLFKAYLRAVTNTAIGLGSVFGGAALVIDESWAYVSVFVLNAVFTGFAAWNTTRLPDLPAYVRGEGEPRLAVLRDWPYVAVVALTGLFSLHFFVMELGLALYISERTSAPPVMVAILLILNTACVALFQVRLSRRADSVQAGARALVRGAVWMAVGFAIISLADRGDAEFAIAVLVVGSLAHVVGEMIGSGGQWGLQMGLAPHERQGQYQGFAGLGFSVVSVVAPPVVTLLCVQMGETGWLVLGALMLAVALVSVPVSRWALASRERYGVLSHSG
ncbi:Major Facilitator Superfamily protein [Nocardioides exalbidus]|uniref:Major Facilitator Superfamily protein n=1 Tax=Nocardioides exalbidus TaxID=402596 RepID=A0A1H4JLU7_9ACTN|nr:MFS transporter [Nocardioides exalbidus]SEB47289.1 Major Facilitator Superfamily protein [Nocardioides exalbidus]